MFIHGWPGHFHEVVKILPLLTEPPEGQQAFHVIAPSIPGFAFSDNPTIKGYNLHKIADTFNKLMISLGYDEYVVQGGDWGSSTARMLGLLYPENCKGVHVNLLKAVHPPRWYKNPWIWVKMHSQLVHYSKEEEALMARSRWFVEKEVGYRVRYFAKSLMTRKFKLLSLRVWLMDCGILLLDCLLGSEKNYIPGRIIILGQMMKSLHGYPISIRPLILGHGNLSPGKSNEIQIYWVTVVTGGLRIYKEADDIDYARSGYVKVPYGVSVFPKDLYGVPKGMVLYSWLTIDWAYTTGNLKFWKMHQSGGHFAAWERPEELVQDLREFYGPKGGAANVVKV
jgi:hypothetical protein